MRDLSKEKLQTIIVRLGLPVLALLLLTRFVFCPAILSSDDDDSAVEITDPVFS